MPSITLQLSENELTAIQEYATQCGETISEIVRKALIREITLSDGYGADSPDYEYQMAVPGKMGRGDERKIIQENYNKIRRILGWREIKL